MKQIKMSLALLCVTALLTFSMINATPSNLSIAHIKTKLEEMMVEDQAAIWLLQKMQGTNLDAFKILDTVWCQLKKLEGKKKSVQELQSDIQKRSELHVAFIRQVIIQYGWPTIDQFGTQACHNVWLFVQHADHDLLFQEECLQHLQRAYVKGQASAIDFAYLYDRVHKNKGMPQLYGTQLTSTGEPYSIQDPKQIDARRISVGLGPLEEYVRKHKNAMGKSRREPIHPQS